MPRGPVSGRLISNMPAPPCVMRETTLVRRLATLNGRAVKATQGDAFGKLETQTWNTPGCATKAAVTGTVTCVLLMKFTAGNVPFTETREFGVKPVPFNVSVKPGLPEKTEA